MNQLTVPEQIKAYKGELDSVLKQVQLPNNVTEKKITNAATVCVTKNPDLLLADRPSLHSSLRTCVSHGLMPDDIEATLQVYNSKVKQNGKEVWIKKVQYMPMIRGIIQRVENSGKVERFWAEMVHKGEDFSIDISQGDRRPSHNPDYFNRQGDIIGVYAVAKLTNGTVDCEPMTLAQINQVKATAKAKNVWEKWFTEKAKVACMRRLAKRLPLSSDDLVMVMGDSEHDFDQTAEMKDVTPDKTLADRLGDHQSGKEPSAEPLDGDCASYDERAVDPFHDAYSEGQEAFKANVSDGDNPHKKNPEFSSWLGGWLFEKDQADD